jgi:acyl-CoA synthetase (AMP-forming)/AMP-acid ligase II
MYVGRKDTQVKIQGFRVELSEVEFQAKKALGDKSQTVAFTRENAQGINEIFLVIEQDTIDESAIKETLKSKLASYMIPKRVFALGSFPLNVNGKIDRKQIKQLLAEHAV